MIVRDDKTVPVDDKPGTQAPLFEIFLGILAGRWSVLKRIAFSERTAEKMAEYPAAALNGLYRSDVDDAGFGIFG